MKDTQKSMLSRRELLSGTAAFAIVSTVRANGHPLKMPLMLDAKRMAIHDGPGIRTTFFGKGCPLSGIVFGSILLTAWAIDLLVEKLA